MTSQSEHLHKEVQRLERQVRERDEEIARLRGELSRAAVREIEKTKALHVIAFEPIGKPEASYREVLGLATQIARVALNSPLNRSRFSDAAQEVLEAASGQREAWKFQLKEDPSLSCCAPETARLIRSVDRWRALLEGREEG